jgi:glycosyltransferase involved in cell wall biosynthesis
MHDPVCYMQKMNESGLISVVIPAYNAGKYIAQAINSVQGQTYTNWELIIINDGSTDNTAETVEKFLSDKRITNYYQRNSGVSVARNNGIEKSSGKYIAFLDADDVWLPRNLETKISFLESEGDYGWVFSDMLEYIQATETVQPAPIGRDDAILDNILLWEGEVVPAPPSNLVLRNECIAGKGILFDENLSTAADQDFCLQLARYYRGKRIAIPLLMYRVTNTSMSRNIALMEKDHRYVYNKAAKHKLFKSFLFRQRCFSNLYFILSANWWKNGNDKSKGMYFAMLAALNYPPVILRYANKLLHANSR